MQAIAPKAEVHEQYNLTLATQSGKYSWGHSACNSYYRTPEGHVPFLFPGGYKDYCRLHEECGLNEFEGIA